MSEIDRLREMIDGAKRIVAFTGAGISTESGIPDFRSPGGIWTKYQPIYFDDFMASEEMRRESWRRKFATDETMVQGRAQCRPPRARQAGRAGQDDARSSPRTSTACTSARACRPTKIIELHGNATYASCLDCGQRYELEPIREAFDGNGDAADLRELRRHREDRDDLVRPGDAGDPDGARPGRDPGLRPVHRAGQLAGGLSGGRLPALAKRNGAALVILNREPTDQDDDADLVSMAKSARP